MQKMTCLKYTTGNAQDWVCPLKKIKMGQNTTMWTESTQSTKEELKYLTLQTIKSKPSNSDLVALWLYTYRPLNQPIYSTGCRPPRTLKCRAPHHQYFSFSLQFLCTLKRFQWIHQFYATKCCAVTVSTRFTDGILPSVNCIHTDFLM